MNCTVCHTELPPGARACPNCGTMVSAYGNTSYNDGTVVSSRNQDPQPPQPGTVYGSDPYRTPAQYNPPPPPPYNQPVQGYSSSPNNVPVQGGYSSSPNNVPVQGGYSSSLNNTPVYGTRSTSISPPYQPGPSISPQPQRSKKIWLIVGIGLLIVILLGGGIFIIPKLVNSNNNQANQNATATSLAQTPAGPNSTQNPYAPRTGKLILNDPMANNNQGNKWDETVIHDTGNPTCGFKSGGYHMTSAGNSGLEEELICEPEAQSLYFNNIAFEANLKIISGDRAGIALRVDQTNTTGYLFTIDTSGNYHLYNMNWKTTNSPSQREQEIGKGGSSGFINKGLNATNLLAIVANGNAISVYVNGNFLESAQDAAYTKGQIGVYGAGPKALDVSVADARVWQL